MARKKVDMADKDLYLNFVYLSKEEHAWLIENLGQAKTEDWIEELNIYLGKSEKNRRKYDSHFWVIRGWYRRAAAAKKPAPQIQSTPNNQGSPYEAAVLIDALRVHRAMPADLPKGIADRFRRMCLRLQSTCRAPRNWPEYHEALRDGHILADWVSKTYQETE